MQKFLKKAILKLWHVEIIFYNDPTGIRMSEIKWIRWNEWAVTGVCTGVQTDVTVLLNEWIFFSWLELKNVTEIKKNINNKQQTK